MQGPVDPNSHLAAVSQAIYNQAMQEQLQQHHAEQQHQLQLHRCYSDVGLSRRSNFVTDTPHTIQSPRAPEIEVMFQNVQRPDLQARERHHVAASSGLFMPSNTSATFSPRISVDPSDSFPRPNFSPQQSGDQSTFSTHVPAQKQLDPEVATAMYEELSRGTLGDYDMLVLAHAAGLIDDHGDLLPGD